MTEGALVLTRIVTTVESDNSEVLQELLNILRNVDIAKYTLFATCMLFVYDWLLTLDEEVFLVWPSRFGVPKILFFLNRYLPFVDLALLIDAYMTGSGSSSCVRVFQAAAGTIAIGFVVAQLILAMRTWAIWARRSTVTVLLAILLLGAIGVDIYVLHRYLGGISFSSLGPVLAVVYEGCPLHFANRFIFVDFVLLMITESVMLTLLVIKALEHFKHSRSTLMVRMFKDGVIHFVFILFTSITNLVVILIAPFELHNFLIITQRIMHSIFCSRVLLHIRGAYTNAALYSSSGPDDSHHVASDAYYTFRRPFSVSQVSGYNHGISSSGTSRVRRVTNTFELTSVAVHEQDSIDVCHTAGTEYTGWGLGYGYDVPGASPISSPKHATALTETESERAWDKAPPLSAVPSTYSPTTEVPWSTRMPSPKMDRGL